MPNKNQKKTAGQGPSQKEPSVSKCLMKISSQLERLIVIGEKKLSGQNYPAFNSKEYLRQEDKNA